VIKASPVKTQIRYWLEGDLLLLAKSSVWMEVFATLIRRSISGGRGSLYPSLVPLGVALLGAIALWQLNGALLLAILIGGGSTTLFYSATQRRLSWSSLEQWLKSPSAPMVLSIGGGFGMLALSYSALSVWQDLNSPWLAIMLLTQEIGIFAALGLAVWLMLTRHSKPLHTFDRCVAGLLHRDELRRLLAVRQLAALVMQGQLSSMERSHASDYLHLLSRKENSPLVLNAIQDSLILLVPPQRKSLGDRSLRSQAARS
jgi:hypothetical protein